MVSDLVHIDNARHALAQAKSVEAVIDIRDKVRAIESYLRRHEGAADAARMALDIRLRAERRLGEMLAETVEHGGSKSRGVTLPEGVERMQSSRWQRIASLPDEVFEQELKRDEPSTSALVKRAKQWQAEENTAGRTVDASESQTCTVEHLDELAGSGKKFGTIYADPPWQYGNQSTRASTDNHYVTMPFDEIAALPIESLAADKSHLHLWTTNGFIREAFALIEAWGFEYKSMFIWVKPEMGIGNYWRVSHEIMLLGVRGNLTFADHSQRSWIQASRQAHSTKPHGVRDIIEKTSPGPYLELFGRQAHPRWTVWGNEVSASLFAQAAGMR